jgi:hypothetical protein
MKVEARLHALKGLEDDGQTMVGLRPRSDVMDFPAAEMTEAERECYERSGCIPVVLSRSAKKGRGKAKKRAPKVCIVPREGAIFEMDDALRLLHKCGTVLEPVPEDDEAGLLRASHKSHIYANHRAFLVELAKAEAAPEPEPAPPAIEVEPEPAPPAIEVEPEPAPKPKRVRKAPARRTRKAKPKETEADG